MNILVCISNVPDTTSAINFSSEGTNFDSNGIQFIINPYDEFGLTKAIKLREKHGGSVTVAHVGLATSDPTLRKALAIGADEAIRINHTPKDSYTTAYHIAEYLKSNSYDLIITGRESIDYNGGAVGGMVAEFLSLPFINACNGLNFSDGIAQITREIDGGKEKLSAKLPLIIGGQKGLVQESELRIPNMRGIMQARTKPLSIIEPSNIETLSTSVKFEKPAEKGACKLVSSDNVGELVSLLQNEAKVI